MSGGKNLLFNPFEMVLERIMASQFQNRIPASPKRLKGVQFWRSLFGAQERLLRGAGRPTFAGHANGCSWQLQNRRSRHEELMQVRCPATPIRTAHPKVCQWPNK